MEHIISYSGGLGSFAVACWVKEKYSNDEIKLVFTDTNFEDEDLYRFIKESSQKLGLELVVIKNTDNPLILMEKDKFLYNSRIANCSKKLKSKPFAEWLKSKDKQNIILYFGIGFEESHRTKAIQANYKGWQVSFPLVDNIIDSSAYLEKYQIKRPVLYDKGFSHNNCGGRCVKGGIGHWLTLLKKDNARFAEMRDFEKRMNVMLNQHHQTENVYSFLKRKGKPYPLYQLEIEFMLNGEQLEIDFGDDIGGCGCFVEN